MTSTGREPAIKICGVTRPEDAVLVVELGATHLGLNFWPGSPRCVDEAAAGKILAAVRRLQEPVTVVGVFVNAPPAQVRALDEALGLDLLQFHGDEAPEDVAAFGAKALRALRVAEPPSPSALALYDGIWGFLFDVHVTGHYGGTGVGWDYGLLGRLAFKKPFFVAGGIRPENACQALEESGAYGLDVCSGVEAGPGRKDPERLRRLFAALRSRYHLPGRER